MTEAEWLASPTPGPLLGYLIGISNTSGRKARLFGCGYLRQVWRQLENKEGSRQAITAAEAFADSGASNLMKARKAAESTAEAWSAPALDEEVWQAVDITLDNAHAFLERVHYETTEEFSEPDFEDPRVSRLLKERQTARYDLYVHLLRDIFGNPFRAATIDPAWLAWNDGTISKLAQTIYDERDLPGGHLDTGRLAILADALEDAGCTNQDILAHCRGPGPHVRGCWVVDLLLGKE